MKTTFSLSLFMFFSYCIFSQGFQTNNAGGIFLSNQITGDFDGDDLIDVIGIRFTYSAGFKLVLASQIDGDEVEFNSSTLSLPFEPAGEMDAKDIDLDGDLDIVVSSSDNQDIYILRNNGAGDFDVEDLGISGCHKVKFIDIENDGDIDIAGININSATLFTYLNNGAGTYALDKEFDSSDDMQFIDIADMDNDGDDDIVITFEEFTGDQVVLFKNSGSTNFDESVIGDSKFKSLNDVAIGDLNGDGYMDVFGVSNLSSQALLSDGNGSYESVEMPEPGGNLLSIEIADFTGEGKNDYIISNTNGIFWFRLVTETPLSYAEFNAGTVAPNYSFATGDLDSDGDLDVVLSNDEMWWLENVLEQLPNTVNELDLALSIYPNPVADVVHIENKLSDSFTTEIRNLNGQLVFTSPLFNNKIYVSELSSGMYILTIKNEKGKASKLFVKE